MDLQCLLVVARHSACLCVFRFGHVITHAFPEYDPGKMKGPDVNICIDKSMRIQLYM